MSKKKTTYIVEFLSKYEIAFQFKLALKRQYIWTQKLGIDFVFRNIFSQPSGVEIEQQSN